jgi:quercetin dioxygenase-like cupin family protein
LQHWDLSSLEASTDKRTDREPGADAPRVPSAGVQKPQVLFSSPECRAVLVELTAGQEMGEHSVRERALVHVVSGRVSIETPGATAQCGAGTLVNLDPDERHAVRALEDARLLLVLAPWPAPGHNTEAEEPHDQHLPANATAPSAEEAGDLRSSAGD